MSCESLRIKRFLLITVVLLVAVLVVAQSGLSPAGGVTAVSPQPTEETESAVVADPSAQDDSLPAVTESPGENANSTPESANAETGVAQEVTPARPQPQAERSTASRAAGNETLSFFSYLGTVDGLRKEVAEQEGKDTTGIPDPHFDYWSGEQIPAVVSLRTSGTDVNLTNAHMRVTFPKLVNKRYTTKQPAEEKYLTSKPVFPKSDLPGARTESSEDDDAWYADYYFPTLAGDVVTDLPFPFTFTNEVTPNGTTITPTMTFESDQFNRGPLNVTFTARASNGFRTELRRYKGNYNSGFENDPAPDSVTGGEKVAVYKFGTDGGTATNMTPPDNPEFRYGPCLAPTGNGEAPHGKGVYAGDNVTFELTLPDGAVASERNFKPGVHGGYKVHWERKPGTTNVITVTAPYNYVLKWFTCDNIHSGGFPVYLTYPNTSIIEKDSQGKTVKRIFRPHLESYVDKGLEGFEVYAGNDNTSTAFLETTDPFAATHAIWMRKDNTFPNPDNTNYRSTTRYVVDGDTVTVRYSGEAYFLRPPEYGTPEEVRKDPETGKRIDGGKDLPGLKWLLLLHQNNNGASYADKTHGIHDFVYSISDYGLDEGLYYQSFYLDLANMTFPEDRKDEMIERFNSHDNYLYGVKASGEKEVIAHNLKLGDKVAIHDTQRKYSSIVFQFDKDGDEPGSNVTPFELDNTTLSFWVRAYPTDKEFTCWKKLDKACGIADGTKVYTNRMKANVHLQAADGKKYDSFAYGNEGPAVDNFDPNNPGTQPQLGNNSVIFETVRPTLRTDIFTTTEEIENSESYKGMPNPFDRFNANERSATYVECKHVSPGECERVKTLEIRTKPTGFWGVAERTLKNYRQIVLLPPGVEYVNTTGHLFGFNIYDNYAKHWKSEGDTQTPEPEVVGNFRNTGKTALIYNWGDVSWESPGHAYNQSNLSLYLNLDFTKNANFGPNEIETFGVWDNTEQIKPDDRIKYDDELDLDGDDNKKESFITNSRSITLSGRRELFGQTRVAVEGVKTWFIDAPAQDFDTGFDYIMQQNNQTLTSEYSMSILGVLPYKNDHKIVPNDGGDYLPRKWNNTNLDGEELSGDHSAFLTPMTGPVTTIEVEDPSGNKRDNARDLFDVFYLTTTPGADLESVRDGQWKEESDITDWSTVTAVKAVLKNGQEIHSHEKVLIHVPAKIPFTSESVKVKDGAKAVFSMASSRHGGIYLEANEVTVQPVRYSVAGGVFRDLNANGVKDPGERWMSGGSWKVEGPGPAPTDPAEPAPRVVVEDPDGTKVQGNLAPNGDNPGFDRTVYPRGNGRTVVFEKSKSAKQRGLYWSQPARTGTPPAGEVSGIAESDKDNDVAVAGSEFALHPNHRREERFAGLAGKGNLTLTKLGKSSPAATQETPMEGVKFTLTFQGWLDSEKPSEDVTLEKTEWTDLVTDANGKLTVAGLPYGKYHLTEVEKPAGYQSLVTCTGEGAKKSCEDGMTFEVSAPEQNVVAYNYRDSVALRFHKQDDESTPLAGVEFALFARDDQGNLADTPAYTARSTDQGLVEFPAVLLGSYVLRETATLPGYSTTADRVIKVAEDSVSVDGEKLNIGEDTNGSGDVVRVANLATPIENPRKLGRISVAKTVAEAGPTGSLPDAGAPLGGAVFGLFAVAEDGSVAQAPKYQATTAQEGEEQGKAVFDSVAWGTYELAEISAPQGFVLTDEHGNKVAKKVIRQITVDGSQLAGDFTLKETDSALEFDAGMVTNDPIYGNIELFKRSETGEPLPGVEFALFKADNAGSVEQETAPSYVAVSDEAGRVYFANVRYGAYELRETKPLEGYVALDRPLGVIVSEHGATTHLGDVTNQKMRGGARLVKVDRQSGEALDSAVFEIFPLDPQLGPVDQPLDTQTSDNQGVVTFNNLLYGHYVVREKFAPAGWVNEGTDYPVTIDADGQIVDLGEIANDRAKGSVTLQKVDAVTGKPLRGAEFSISAAVVYGTESGMVVGTGTSDSAGHVTFDDLDYGTYVVRETKAPEGYVLDSRDILVAVMTDGVVTDLGEIANNPVPSTPTKPGDDPQPKTPLDVIGKLAQTGANVYGLLLVAFLLVGLGAALLYTRRRRS